MVGVFQVVVSAGTWPGVHNIPSSVTVPRPIGVPPANRAAGASHIPRWRSAAQDHSPNGWRGYRMAETVARGIDNARRQVRKGTWPTAGADWQAGASALRRAKPHLLANPVPRGSQSGARHGMPVASLVNERNCRLGSYIRRNAVPCGGNRFGIY